VPKAQVAEAVAIVSMGLMLPGAPRRSITTELCFCIAEPQIVTARPSYRLLAAAFCLFAAGGRAAVADPVDFEPALPMLRTPFAPRIPSPHLFSGEMRLSSHRSERRADALPQPAEPKPPAPTVALQPAAVQPADSTVSDAARSRTAPTVPLRSATAVQSVSLSRDLAARDARLARLPGYPAPMQPAEVFSVPRPDFFAEEIQLTALNQQLPGAPSLLQPAEIAPAGPPAIPPPPAEPLARLAMLQQPLPAPQMPLVPAEVLPSTPYNPAAPRVPALDQDRPIGALTTNIMPVSGLMPQDIAAEHFQGDYPAWASSGYSQTVYFWDAPALCYGPLRFEEVNLERYGYGCCHVLQPFVSAAHFAGSLVSLPYNIVNRPCWECIAPLGHYRPGSPVPYRKIWPEWNPVAAAAECGAIAGLILLIP
jgi:hypothetical protein